MAAAVPEVSIVLPTHNRHALLAQTLRTVLWQEGVDLEVLVVDDGSTDETSRVVRGIDDDRIRLLSNVVPVGVSGARNRGISEARGEWIALLDDDDLWAPEKLASQLRAARSTGRDWAYTGSVNITLDGRLIGGAPPLPPDVVAATLPIANVIPGGCSGVVLRKDAIDGNDVFDASYHHLADWDLWIRLARWGMPAWVPQPLVGYRVHAGNASHDTDGMVAELDTIERRYGGHVDRVRFYRHVARVSRRAGRRRQALTYYARAAALRDPAYLRHAFLPDVREVLDELLQEFGRRSGRSLPTIRPRHAQDPFRDWKEQARPWIQRLFDTHE
jgi:glycosyltransferase involved in cell wall biosynthesis